MGYTIRCVACHGDKPGTKHYFADKQLVKAKKGSFARCLVCTKKEPTLVCSTCNHEKPVSAFTKAQRREKEYATCIVCMSQVDADENTADDFDSATVLPVMVDKPDRKECFNADAPNGPLRFKIYEFSPLAPEKVTTSGAKISQAPGRRKDLLVFE